MMNLQSPTTLLSSIQSMRSKLRCDKQILLDLKQDFTKFGKKKDPYIHENAQNMPKSIQKYNKNQSEQNEGINLDKPPKGKLLQLKKEHQKEMMRIKEAHEQEINMLLQQKKLQIEDMQNAWRLKLDEQTHYISILEEQVNAPLSSGRAKSEVKHEQYDAVINKLLQDNTRLHEEVAKAKEETSKWKQMYHQLQTQKINKSRFKFGKNKKQGNYMSHYEVDSSRMQRKRVNSVYLCEKQNRDSTNFYDEQWQDMIIQDDEGGLKTIKQFQIASLNGKSQNFTKHN